ncbi:MAG: ABC transporter permease [Litorivicinaceae bacterium]|jgi:general nucleoside transport system permease protein|nr:ABC transporter permease [Litorivicinaceae bacterium]
MIRLIRRADVTAIHSLISIAVAAVLTLVISTIVLFLTAKAPVDALMQLLTYPYQGGTVIVQWSKALNMAAYLGVIGLGLSICYRANVWNIGAEGQFAMGGIGAFGTWLLLGSPTAWWAIPCLIMGGAFAGLLWASIPALLKTQANTNELLTSLMLVYVAAQTLFFVSNGPWQAPVRYSPSQTVFLPESVQLNAIIPGVPTFHMGLPIALGLFVVIALLVLYTPFGYRLKVTETTPRAARFAGYSPRVTVWAVFLLSGAMAGAMGAIYLMGDIGYVTEESNFLRGFGFSAIVVAFLGRLHPVGILLAALLLGYVAGGASWIQANLREDDSIAGFIEVIALMSTLASALFLQYRVQWRGFATQPQENR